MDEYTVCKLFRGQYFHPFSKSNGILFTRRRIFVEFILAEEYQSQSTVHDLRPSTFTSIFHSIFLHFSPSSSSLKFYFLFTKRRNKINLHKYDHFYTKLFHPWNILLKTIKQIPISN